MFYDLEVEEGFFKHIKSRNCNWKKHTDFNQQNGMAKVERSRRHLGLENNLHPKKVQTRDKHLWIITQYTEKIAQRQEGQVSQWQNTETQHRAETP